jgi:transcriptional regulator with XRE-family HTH domain
MRLSIISFYGIYHIYHKNDKGESKVIGHVDGEKIISLRKKRGMSQETLAEAVGITRCQLQRIESGKRSNMLFTTGLRLAEVLQVLPEDIYIFKDYEENK